MDHDPDFPQSSASLSLLVAAIVALLLYQLAAWVYRLSLRLLSWLSSPRSSQIALPLVKVHTIEASPIRRDRCLKHLLKANHANYAIVYSLDRLSNQTAHLLCSAYLVGLSDSALNSLYATETQNLEKWSPSPAEIVDTDWRDFFGDRRYQRAYVDFFEDKLVMQFAFDWKRQVQHLLFDAGQDDQPLFHGLIGGLGHPLVHLGYAYEMDSKELAMEALALACIQQNFLQRYTSNSEYRRPSALASDTPLNLLRLLSQDQRFQKLPQSPGSRNLEDFFYSHVDLAMEYWNAWDLENGPQKQFELSQEAVVALLLGTADAKTHSYNFFAAHLLAASHGVRVLLPILPPKHRLSLVRDWWLLVIAAYIMIGRPHFEGCDRMSHQDAAGKDWAYVTKLLHATRWKNDAHFLKYEGVRAMLQASTTWEDSDWKYRQAAVMFVETFNGWH